jgi:3-phenylpropionate/cinnamic acid dioxygenase small subunit
MTGAPPARDGAMARLLYEEARLLDAGRFEDWLALFAPDGVYWVPSQRGQTDPLTVPSIIYEDRGILAIRVRRLAHPRAHVLAPMPRTTHLVTNVETVESDAAADEHRVDSALLVVEHRDNRQRLFSGRCTHRLRHRDGVLKIVMKRVDLADCDGVHGAITIPL